MKAIVVRAHSRIEQLKLEPDFPDPRSGEGDASYGSGRRP